MRLTFALLRLIAAVAVLVAVGVNFGVSLAFWIDARFRDVPTLVINFASYLTILSILASAVVLVIGAVRLFGRARLDSPGFALARATTVTAMVIVGTVYNLLLRETSVSGGGDVPQWTNEVMHVVLPLYLIVDWLAAPGRRRLSWRSVPLQLLPPLLWLVYTLIRAPFVYDQFIHVQGWYPYPFLDPDRSSSGYLSVAAYIVAVTVIFAAVATVTVTVSRWPHPLSRVGAS
ncbi:Pr6Pr family membrane protein [Microbacteriaceae bacterium VKM Ac-2855]|nr:Pr6Pr family membrane protein [Microbacteriaceae bacterium VKM Ac-2855]